MEKIKIGLVGCGRISGKHFSSLENNPNAEFVAVCDNNEQRAEKAGSENNCKVYLNYDELLKNPEINLIAICTPSGMHPAMAIKAMNAKKHVLTEKPMAVKSSDARQMIQTAKDNNVKLFVVKQNRFNPAVMELEKAVKSERFGKNILIKATVYWSRDQAYYDQDEWRGTKAMDGGVLMNQAIHHIDLVQWLGGEVESVCGYSSTRTHDIEAEDTAVAILKFKSGALGVIEATTCTCPTDIEGSVTILGENGSAKIGGFAVNKVDLWDFKETLREDKFISEKSTNPSNVYGFSHAILYKNIIDSLLFGKEALIPGESGIKSLEIVEAIYKSIDEKREVKL